MLNKLIKKIKDKFNLEPNVTIQKFQPVFITIDNHIHNGAVCNWAIKDRISYPIPDYLMMLICSKEYIKDEHGVMYLLSNIKSINWNLIDEKSVPDIYDGDDVCLTNQESKNIDFLNLQIDNDNN